MTLPFERHWAVDQSRQFLVDLLDPKKTPRVPSAIRKEAYRCLKHYPSEYYMELAADQAPQVFGPWYRSDDRDSKRPATNNINRVEVIDSTGRAYVHYLSEGEKVAYSIQDDGRTLKVFIDICNRDQDV